MTREMPGADSDRPSGAYERFGVTVHHGDCLDVLATLPDASVHAVVTDPPYELAFMGRKWDASGIAFNPDVWRECLRVLKPGGHLLAFGGSRTWHRLACAIEDAGFEMRDSIAWLYGSGFPKSMDVSKAIDKAAGDSPVIQGRALREARERAGLTRDQVAAEIGCRPQSVGDWEDGRSRAVGGPREVCIPSARYRDKLTVLLGYADEAERDVLGTESRFNEPSGIVNAGQGERKLIERHITAPATPAAQQWSGWGTALKPAHEPVVCARKPLSGTVAATVLEHGTGALNIDGTRFGGDAGRWPTNVVLDGDAADELGDTSKFFPVFRYQAKAPAKERPRVGGIAHPTVKPLALMRWLVRLVTPAGGTVLDPFLGSGTTAQAARDEGFVCLGIESYEPYIDLIRARLDARLQQSTPEAKGAPEVLDLLDLLTEDGAA